MELEGWEGGAGRVDAGWRVGGPPRWEGGAGRMEGGWEGGGLLFIVSSEGLLESLHRI